MTERMVMLSVYADDDETFANIFERLARMCAGFVIEGKPAHVSGGEVVADEEVET